MNETARYLGKEGERIFSVLHVPVAPCSRGIIVCAPLGEEMLWSRRVLVTFARELADNGYAVLRFDYRGEGDSDGWFEESSVTSRLADTSLAIESLRSLVPSIEDVTLVGLRFGATIAAMAAATRKDISRLILWDPVTDGADYMQGVLRLNLMYQMALYRKVIENREQLVARLEEGQTINIEGYGLGGHFYKEASEISLAQSLDRFTGPVQLVSILPRSAMERPDLESLAAARPRTTLSSVIEEAFWREIRTFYQRADQLFDATMQWLGDQG